MGIRQVLGLDALAGRRAERRRRRHERRLVRRRRVAREVAERFGSRVRQGPFAGVEYPWFEAAGSPFTPKLLGSYEQELHPWLERLIARGPRRVVNVGCGEGYYAVGLARRLPGAMVLAFDADPRARELCGELAARNGVAARVRVEGECGPARLAEAVAEPALVVCDCEGGEVELLRPDLAPALLHCDLLVEVHRVPGAPDTAALIRARFAGTHAAERVRFGGRNRLRYPELRFLGWRDRRIALAEHRRRGREWLLLVRRGEDGGETDLGTSERSS